jgi:alanyl-tRNA synthetase
MRTPDLENVGKTARHHTFFEMLGYFSFGDGMSGPNGSFGFFKKEAIRWIWDFYTSPEAEGGCGLDKSKLYVSVYGGDENGDGRDVEAAKLWKEILSPIHGDDLDGKRIFYLDEHDNFWPAGAPSQGPNGVCGPCSEIFYDLGGPGEGNVETNDDRFMEIGNIVFTQYERSGPVPGKGELTPLPQKNIDFGGGFERLVMVLEDVPTTLDTSLFTPVREKMRELGGYETPPNDSEDWVREKRIADHLRAAVFCIADGVSPGKEKAEYIIRRIVRRAFRDGKALGFDGPFLHKLVPTLVEQYGDAYPELKRNPSGIAGILESEEKHFSETLERGLQLLGAAIEKADKSKPFSGKVAFDLYQSAGLPVDVVRDELLASEMTLDEEAYTKAEEDHIKVSSAGGKGALFDKGWFNELKALASVTEFSGYDNDSDTGNIVGIGKGDDLVASISTNDEATIVLGQTPFYAESGGQVGDTGKLVGPNGVFEVTDTKQRDDYFLHKGKVAEGEIKTGDEVKAEVDTANRSATKANHSATHLMHAALRNVLGEHVLQKGSEVGPERLRFDFSHGQAVSFKERQQIERQVNEEIQANTPVSTDVMSPEDAQNAGAMALFGEKYGDSVRVLSMGRGDDSPYSRELCGGTHAERTGDIGLFKITHEGSSSAGVRRIEAVTGSAALKIAEEESATLARLHATTKAQPGKLEAKIESLLKEVKDLKSKAKSSGGAVDPKILESIMTDVKTIGDTKVYVHDVRNVEADELLTIKDALGQDSASSAILLGSSGKGRALLLLAFSKDLLGRGLHAGKIIGEIARLVGGGGGGKPQQAQAGGKNPDGMAEALQLGAQRIEEGLGK